MSNVVTLFDGLRDFITGLGGERDRTTTQSFAPVAPISPAEIESMYRTDWLAAKIVDIVPQDMVRAGRRWQATADQITAIEEVEQSREVQLWPKLREALGRARLVGGCCIMIGIRNQSPMTELDPDSVEQGDLAYLNVIPRTKLSWDELDLDPQSPWYGSPRMWRLNSVEGRTIYVHPSRMLKFGGIQLLTRDVSSGQDYVWGDPILQRVYEAVRNAASVQQHVAGLVPDARNDVIYVPGLGDILNNPQDRLKLQNRFAHARTMRSMFNLLLLEGNGVTGAGARGESWQQRQVSFSQLPDLMRSYIQVTAGAADIPVTRLLGESPAGENSTGEADLRNYYDHIGAMQTLQLNPQLWVLDRVLKRTAGVDDKKIFYVWAPLWSMSPREQAEILDKTASAARRLVGSGKDMPIVDVRPLSNSIVNTLTENGSLPGLESEVAKFGSLDKIVGPDDVLPKPEPAPQPANENTGPSRQATADAAPRSLYVRRQLLNVSEFVRWASDQGIRAIVPGDQLHVTVMFCRTPIDWMEMRADWGGDSRGRIVVPPGGPRVVERLGETATVLTFWSDQLQWRHSAMRERGAVHSFDDYVTHVTISHESQQIDLSGVTPFQGELRFGPEIFEEVDEDWRSKVR